MVSASNEDCNENSPVNGTDIGDTDLFYASAQYGETVPIHGNYLGPASLPRDYVIQSRKAIVSTSPRPSTAATAERIWWSGRSATDQLSRRAAMPRDFVRDGVRETEWSAKWTTEFYL